jgi:hypothetical protein
VTGRERTLGELADDLERLARQVERLTDRLDNAPFVRLDLHNEQINNLRSDISGLRTLLMWVLGILASVLISAIVLGISAVAGGP